MPRTARSPLVHALGVAIPLLAGVAASYAAEGGGEAEAMTPPAQTAPVPQVRGDGASLRQRLDAIALRGAGLREQGRPEEALAVLEQGHNEMLRHDKAGTQLQAYIDGLRLQVEYGMTLIQLGRLSLGDEFIATARKAVELAHARRELGPLRQSPASVRFVVASLHGGEALEMALVEFYTRRIEKPVPGLDAQLASERLIDAYRRAETWVLRQAMADAGDGTRRNAAQRVADLRLALARALRTAGRPQDAAAEFVAAAVLSCTLAGEPGQRSCARATLGWAEATGGIGSGDDAGARPSRWQQALGLAASPPDVWPDP